jgi:hypothetical protein
MTTEWRDQRPADPSQNEAVKELRKQWPKTTTGKDPT